MGASDVMGSAVCDAGFDDSCCSTAIGYLLSVRRDRNARTKTLPSAVALTAEKRFQIDFHNLAVCEIVELMEVSPEHQPKILRAMVIMNRTGMKTSFCM